MKECNTDESAQSRSRRAAHELWVELSTRITAKDLHFRSGQEEAAVESIVTIFETTRSLMKQALGAEEFLRVAAVLLQTIRPYTARWHGMQGADERFRGPAERLQFREEIQRLQREARPLADLLKELSMHGKCIHIPEAPAESQPNLDGRVRMGIVPQGLRQARADPQSKEPLSVEEAHAKINMKEGEHIVRRRPSSPEAFIYDGSGLALSGGGIRSATFCLGVVQVLAQAGLLAKFDYLSTVSGGGYLGSFISNQGAAAAVSKAEFEKVFTGATDSEQVRHLRNSSKYLLPETTLQRLKLAGLLISGTLATTLLVLFIPVFCALAVHFLSRYWLGGTSAPPSDWWQPLWLAAAGFGVVAAACWLLRPIAFVWRHFRNPLDTIAAYSSLLAGVCIAIALTPLCVHLLEVLETRSPLLNWKLTSASIASLIALASGACVIKAVSVAWKYRKALSRLFILSGVVLFVIVYIALAQWLGVESKMPVDVATRELLVSGILLGWLVWAALVSLNLTGLHRYYRDRLASCYLEKQPPAAKPAQPPKLEELSPHLPYHLINTTVNLTSSDDPNLRGRGGDFFLLSKYFCGSTITGYHPTEEVSKVNRDLDLATAMAISGAAASTNMGWQTLREYRTLMAILNVRLGYWMRWNRKKFGWFASSAFVQLMREILGSLDEKSSTINVSDGGHIENLAAYELIRRRLKFIVCVDGGLDNAMECADLNRLQRLVAVDFGYRIEFDPSDLKLAGGFSRAYGVLVKIDYTPETAAASKKELGWMLYIKLAVLGTESNYVLDYRRENPVFPHQSTLDQFFDEAQFEAYRRLGEAAALSFLSSRFDTLTVNGFQDWFQRLAGYLLPDSDPIYGARHGHPVS